MVLETLNKEYDKLQKIYGAKELDSIYHGGCRVQVPLIHLVVVLVTLVITSCI